MLDECKGDKLEEVLAVFSNAVLKKVVQESPEHAAIAQQLALENFSYTGERTVLSALIVVHKATLSKVLRERKESKALYLDFSNLLDLNDRRIARRHEQLKQAIEESTSQDRLSPREAGHFQDVAQKNWSGNSEWLQCILYGDSQINGEGLLATDFEKVWKNVENGSISEIEGKRQSGLLEQLNARVQDQENRLARWQDFGRSISKKVEPSPSKQRVMTVPGNQKINLGFNKHQVLQVSSRVSEVATTSTSLDEYNRLIENMKTELADVGKPQTRTDRPQRRSLLPESRFSSPMPSPNPVAKSTNDDDEGWSSVSDPDEQSPGSLAKSASHTPPSESPVTMSKPDVAPKTSQPVSKAIANYVEDDIPISSHKLQPRRARSPSPRPRTPPPMDIPKLSSAETEGDLADQILNSMSAASPSPKKSRHTLSLAERTRLSMSRASHSQYSDLHDTHEISDLPRLTLKSRPSLVARTPSAESENDLHAGLIERTRKSMAGFEAAQKKAQLARRQSVKDERRKARESSYFPKVEEEPITPEVDVSAVELMDGDPDYESVFKSRPKIKTSPAVSPTRIWEEDEE